MDYVLSACSDYPANLNQEIFILRSFSWFRLASGTVLLSKSRDSLEKHLAMKLTTL